MWQHADVCLHIGASANKNPLALVIYKVAILSLDGSCFGYDCRTGTLLFIPIDDPIAVSSFLWESLAGVRARNFWYFGSKFMPPCFLICYRDSHVVANAFLCIVCNAIIYTTQDDHGVNMYIQFCYHEISFATWS